MNQKPAHVIAVINQINAMIERIKIAERDGLWPLRNELIAACARLMMAGLRSPDRWHYAEVVEYFDGNWLREEGITMEEYIRFWEDMEKRNKKS